MTLDIALTLGVLGVTALLFATEVVRVDVAALGALVALAWLGLVTPAEATAGLSSTAVVAVIAVMILGHGVDRSGAMGRVTRAVLGWAGGGEKKLVALVSGSVGLLSGFMQNVGAAALFLPALLRIARATGIPAGRLVMPMGFAAILGGTVTLVGSSPLILLNDLLRQAGQEPYGLFGVTPLGLALLAAGVAYFLLLGGRVLPVRAPSPGAPSPQQELVDTWHLPSTVRACRVPPGSALAGRTREEAALWSRHGLNLLTLTQGRDVLFAPWRFTRFAPGQVLALLGPAEAFAAFCAEYGLEVVAPPAETDGAGFAELVIPPRSGAVGHTMRQLELRRTYGVEPLVRLSGREAHREDFSDEVLEPGDALVVYGPWGNLARMGEGGTFALVSPLGPVAAARPRPGVALGCLGAALGLGLAGAPLAVSLLTGAVAMIVSRVVTADEAYRAVDWRTVFLLAGLIPLGTAMEKTGAAAYLADLALTPLAGAHPLLILGALGALTTLLSLFLSNVAATVLLVPLAVAVAQGAGLPPRALALLVAVCASNSFVLPTHQVNALILGPGNYRNADFLRAGGGLTLLFLAVAVGFIYAAYL